MDVSIITSLYKSDFFLRKYIKRTELFNKRISKYNLEIEFIIIANDISIEEEKELAKCRLSNLKIIKVPRETLYASWNRGIREASSEIVTFWNVDDLRFSSAIYNGVSQIRKGSELVYFSFIIFGIQRVSIFKKRIRLPFLIFKRVNAEPYNRELFMRGCKGGPFFMFHRQVVDKIGPFDSTFTIAGDFEWFVRASFNYIKIKEDKHIGGIFFVHSSNISGINHLIHVNENEEVSNKYYRNSEN